MKIKEILQKAWENKGQISEGFYNAYLSQNKEIREEALRRLKICRTNQCGYYNPEGKNEGDMIAVFPGAESCGACGCKLYEACHSLSKTCSLIDKGQEPLWSAILTQEQEDELNRQAAEKRKKWEENQKAKRG